MEHRHRPVQPADRRRMGRTLQSDLRIRLRLLENCDFSIFRRRVRVLINNKKKNHSFTATIVARNLPGIVYSNVFCYYNNIVDIRFNRVATGNPVVFTLSPPECYMEIRYGYGTTGNRVGGPVRVGDPLTLIIYMRSKYGNDSNKIL